MSWKIKLKTSLNLVPGLHATQYSQNLNNLIFEVNMFLNLFENMIKFEFE